MAHGARHCIAYHCINLIHGAGIAYTATCAIWNGDATSFHQIPTNYPILNTNMVWTGTTTDNIALRTFYPDGKIYDFAFESNKAVPATVGEKPAFRQDKIDLSLTQLRGRLSIPIPEIPPIWPTQRATIIRAARPKPTIRPVPTADRQRGGRRTDSYKTGVEIR